MNRALIGILATPGLLGACAAVPAPRAAPVQFYAQYESKLMVDVGQRYLDSAFEPVDDQTAFGLELDVRQPNASTGLELGIHYSRDSAARDVAGLGRVDFEGSMTEISVGGRWYHDRAFANGRPYACAGASLLLPEYDVNPPFGETKHDSDWTIGPYLRGGMEWSIGDSLSLALDYRMVILSNIVQDVDVGISRSDANYQQIGVVLGWSF